MIPLVVAVLVAAVLLWLANQAAFHPSAYPEGPWHLQTSLGAKDVPIRSADGTLLHAWSAGPSDPLVWTLFLHGNAGNVSHRSGAILALKAAGSGILLPDYRGYGKSQGRPTEAGLYRDAEAAYAHLREQGVDPSRIILHGESLGSAVAVYLASRVPCAGIVLEAPFTSARAMAARVLPLVGPLLVWGFDTRARISEIRAPLLIIHGDRDSIVPFAMGEELYAAAPQPKTFHRLQGAGHNNLVDAGGAEYVETLRRFYQSVTTAQFQR